MKLSELPVFFLDLQTTGSSPESAHILEIAWKISGSQDLQSHLWAQPEGVDIPRRISMLTGIYPKDMANALAGAEILSLLEKDLSSFAQPMSVIHFAQFERPFLTSAFTEHAKELFPIVCTNEIAKRLLPNLPTRGMKGLAGYFGYGSLEFKRATSNVLATEFIWQNLLGLLAEKSIHTLEELQAWLAETPKVSRTKYEYPLDKEKRLKLPKVPGIYRMINKAGDVLYVGKATSLHDRVNSYFRGQKNRDTRKLEMLTQVHDLRVTPVGSPLEAALLETDEIKRLDPPYNVSLKTGTRSMVFFNHDLSSMSLEADSEHIIGPFSNSMVLDSMLKLAESLQSGVFTPNMFFDPLEVDLIVSGYYEFCRRHGFDIEKYKSVRAILAQGLLWVREEIRLEAELSELELEEEELLESDLEADVEEVEIEEEIILTAEDIADKFERHFKRVARAYMRTKRMTRLLNADICFGDESSKLSMRHGHVDIEKNLPVTKHWQGLSIDTYDRITVLHTELERIRKQSEQELAIEFL
jgi:Nuclease subunit of the excinuclease complex